MNSPQVLSLIEGYLGHRTYGQLMRDYFSSSACNVDFYWCNEERELTTRVLNRLLSFYFPNDWIQKQNLDFHWLRIQIGFGYMAKRLAARKLALANYSVLHFHSQPLAFFSVDLMQLPTVVSLDATSAQMSKGTDLDWRWTYNPNLLLEKRVFNAAARVVTFSESARRSVVEDYQIAEEKVKVIYPGVNVNTITPAGESKELSPRRFKILFVGGDFERKGGRDVLAVFLETFSAQAAELHLVTQALVKCQHPHVYIYNNVKAYTSKWLELYQQADVFVMPTYAEPFGWVFIEAMAAGLPVIATCINAISEIVTHGETGFLIQPGDRDDLAGRMRQLKDKPILSREMGRKGRQVVERKFNAQTNFQALESIFREISVL